MVFKLVRTDSEEPCKIQLPLGTHLIGRGKFLDCDDKRVSRKHGELEVTNDAITIKALHQNPCFYIKKGSLETQIIKQDCSVNLSHGDKFGLLPNSCWYELLHCSGLDIGLSPERANDENTEPLGDQTVTTTENGLENSTDDEGLLNCDVEGAVSASQRSESPSILPPAPVSPSLTPREVSPQRQGDAPAASNQSSTQVPPSDPTPDQGSPLPKRCHSPVDSKDEVKKVKVEPDIKQEPDVKPGPSGDQGPSGDGANITVPVMPPSPAKPVAPGRERCIYGASCYRRNPQHKAQFAHPTDADWGAGARGVCPYGAGCRRRDPRHWRDHDHPPGVQPPPPPRQPAQRRRTKREKRSDSENSSDDDDTPQTSLIVTGKRSRKTIKRPSYSGSDFDDDEIDPFGTDEEDEWVPGSQSQYSQDTQED